MHEDRGEVEQHFRFSIGDLLLLVTMIAILVGFLRLLSQFPHNILWLILPLSVSATTGGIIGARMKHGLGALRGAVWGTLVGGVAFALFVYPSMLVMAAAHS